MPDYLERPDGLHLSLRVMPRAVRQTLELGPSGELLARVNGPPVDGAANAAVRILLADLFEVARSNVRLLHGARSRNKTWLVEGDPGALRRRLERYLGSLMA